MIGTIERNGAIQVRLSSAMAAVDYLRVLGWRGRKEIRELVHGYRNSHHRSPACAKTIRHLKRAAALSGSFKVVERDETVMRRVTAKSGYTTKQVNVPLLFHTRLPAKIMTTIEVSVDRETFRATAVTPMPTTEALSAMRQHRKKFDWVELWWVPNDVLVEKIPDPDPIVVGAVKVAGGEVFYFELHRWIDETVEAGWWTKEGY